MFPTLPNNIYNILFTLGIFLLGYIFIQDSKFNHQIRDNVNKINLLVDKYNEDAKLMDKNLKALKFRSKELAELNDLKNPITETDSTISFKQHFSGDKRVIQIDREVEKLWSKYVDHKDKNEMLSKQTDDNIKLLRDDNEYTKSEQTLHQFFIILSVLFIFIGAAGLINRQVLLDCTFR